MRPLHAAADERHGLRAAPAVTILRPFGLNATDHVDAQIAELGVEEAVIRMAAELAVGDEFEAELLLQADDVADRLVRRLRQFGLIDFAARKARALFHQLRRTQQAADMLGAERRLGYGDGCANIHGVTLPVSSSLLTRA
jgi:hypothetical protein